MQKESNKEEEVVVDGEDLAIDVLQHLHEGNFDGEVISADEEGFSNEAVQEAAICEGTSEVQGHEAAIQEGPSEVHAHLDEEEVNDEVIEALCESIINSFPRSRASKLLWLTFGIC